MSSSVSRIDEMYAASSLLDLRFNGDRRRLPPLQSTQRIQLPPLILPPPSCHSIYSPQSTYHSSSTVTTSYTYQHFASHRPSSSSSSSAIRLPPFTPPPPMPMQNDESLVLSQHRHQQRQSLSQSPCHSYFAACQQSHPGNHGHFLSPHHSYAYASHQPGHSPSNQGFLSPPKHFSPSTYNFRYSPLYKYRDVSPTFAIKTQCDAGQDLPHPKALSPTTKSEPIPSKDIVAPKTRSSLQRTNKSKVQPVRKKSSTSIEQRLSLWVSHLCTFLNSDQEQLNLHSAKEGTVFTTMPNTVTTCKTIRPAAKSTTNRSRSSNHGNISTHRFIIPIDVATLKTHDYSTLFATSTSADVDDIAARHHCCYISCVRWEREMWITNSDICHIVKFRMEAIGFKVTDREKLFEGVYSDLRIVTKKDYRYEEAKGSFLNALDEYGCISMHKRQKLYKWSSVPHLQLYTSAIRRCIQGGKACKPLRQPALRLCSRELDLEAFLST